MYLEILFDFYALTFRKNTFNVGASLVKRWGAVISHTPLRMGRNWKYFRIKLSLISIKLLSIFFLLKWRQLNNTSFTLWSNPAWITVTFKWFVTRPMLTSRIGNTSWTIGTVPSNLTSAMIRSSAFSIDASFNELIPSNNESWMNLQILIFFS